jgi:hypothetical protein
MVVMLTSSLQDSGLLECYAVSIFALIFSCNSAKPDALLSLLDAKDNGISILQNVCNSANRLSVTFPKIRILRNVSVRT